MFFGVLGVASGLVRSKVGDPTAAFLLNVLFNFGPGALGTVGSWFECWS